MESFPVKNIRFIVLSDAYFDWSNYVRLTKTKQIHATLFLHGLFLHDVE